MGERVQDQVEDSLICYNRHISSLRGKLFIVRSPGGFYFKVSTILLSNFTQIGENRITLSVKANAKVVPVLLSSHASKRRFAKLRVRRRYTRVTSHDIECGNLRSEIQVIRNSVERTTKVFKTTSFSIIAYGPPCVVKRRKLAGPRLPGTVTERRVLYSFSSITYRTTQILGSQKQFFLIREPFQLIRLVTALAGCGLRPGEVRLICPFVSGRPGVILVRTYGNKGSEVQIRQPLIICRQPKICARSILRLCQVI